MNVLPPLGPFRSRGDEAADLAVRDATAGGLNLRAVSDLLDALIRWFPGGGEPPPAAVTDFLAAPPGWHAVETRDAVERGQQVFQSRSTQSFLILGLAGLPVCYAIPSIAETLLVRGRLAVQVDLRLRETATFVAAVMIPGALRAGGLGLVWCRKVRLVHACMRLLARASPPPPDWPSFGELQDALLARDPEPRDRHPIDQVELALVLQTFAELVLRSWSELGARANPNEREDYLAAWNAIGHELGIDHALLPRADARGRRPAKQVFDQLLRSEQGPNRNGRLLTATLLVAMRAAIRRGFPKLVDLQQETRLGSELSLLRAVPRGVLRILDGMLERSLASLPRSYVRQLIGRPLAHDLDVDRAPLWHFVLHRAVMAAFRWVGPALLARSLRGPDAVRGAFAPLAEQVVQRLPGELVGRSCGVELRAPVHAPRRDG